MNNNSEDIKDFILKCLEEKKAENVTCISLKGEVPIADYMIFASGRSTKNVSSIAESVSSSVKDKTGLKVSLEGFRTGTWVVLAVSDITVHIFHPETREYYNVEEIFEPSDSKTAKAK
jgi:ribosome-associated protein